MCFVYYTGEICVLYTGNCAIRVILYWQLNNILIIYWQLSNMSDDKLAPVQPGVFHTNVTKVSSIRGASANVTYVTVRVGTVKANVTAVAVVSVSMQMADIESTNVM